MKNIKLRFDWKMFLVFAIISFCLYLLTHSFLMTLGVLLLMIVADQFIIAYDERKRKEWENIGAEYRKKEDDDSVEGE